MLKSCFNKFLPDMPLATLLTSITVISGLMLLLSAPALLAQQDEPAPALLAQQDEPAPAPIAQQNENAQVQSASQTKQANPSITIGLSLPLTGDINPLAKLFLAGAQLAIDDFNNIHLGRPARIITSDDGCSTQMAKLSTEELLATKPDIITGFLCNKAAIETANALKQSDIPLLIASARSRRLTADRRREQWKLWQLAPSDGQDAQYAAENLSQRWQDKRIAVIDDGTTFARSTAESFLAQMTILGADIDHRDTLRPGDTQHNQLLERLRKQKIERAYIAGTTQDIALIAKNAAEIGYQLEIAAPETLIDLTYMDEETRKAANGLIVALAYQAREFPKAEQVLERARLRDLEPDPYITLGYQTLEVALQSIGDNPTATIERLNTMTFDTIFGAVSFSSKGALASSPYRLYRWNGEEFLLIQIGN